MELLHEFFASCSTIVVEPTDEIARVFWESWERPVLYKLNNNGTGDDCYAFMYQNDHGLYNAWVYGSIFKHADQYQLLNLVMTHVKSLVDKQQQPPDTVHFD